MGLITKNTPNTARDAADPELIRLATVLQNSLREIGKPICSQMRTWVRHLRLCLANECGGDAALLAAAVEWYAKNCGKRYTPQAWSAAGFRAKFHAVHAAMLRDQERNPTVVVTDKARAVAARTSVLRFPDSVKAKLPELAQATMDAYAVHRAKLSAWVKANTDHAVAHLDRALPGAERYAELYLTEFVHNRASWEKWYGDVSKLYWNKDHPHLHERIKRILSDYGARAGAFDKAKEVMGL